MLSIIVLVLQLLFFSTAYTQNFASFFQNFTHKYKNLTKC